MNPRRTLINVISFLLISAFLIYFGATRFLFPQEEGRRVYMEVANASGLLPRSDVTVRGVPSGAIEGVRLTEEGTADVAIILDPGVTITEGTTADITRRSPIGDITVNLTPGQGSEMPDGGRIPMADVTTPPDPVRTIEVLADLLDSVSPDNIEIMLSELADAVRGREADLVTLQEEGANLPERILQVKAELESLIRTGPEVLDVLAANIQTLADDITQTAVLADILRDNRFDLVELMRNGADFAQILGELIVAEKPNLVCMIQDFGRINAEIAKPGNLEDLKAVLDLNHFFFGGADQAVQHGKDGFHWFRVHFLLPQEPHARQYAQQRQRPDVYAANSCQTIYGPGVGPGTQPHRPYLGPGSEFHPGE
jgi:phospholipid/cholesterol/gamma-HCH transport system substrate-binding protein